MKDKLFQGKLSGSLIAVLCCLLWGSLFPCIKLGYAAFSVASSDIFSILLFAGTRFTVCGLILVAFVSAKDRRLTLPDRNTLIPVLTVAAVTIVIHYSLTYIGLSLGEGSKSAILKQIGYLFISAFAFLFHKDDKFTVHKLICGILGFAGIIVVNANGGAFTFSAGDVVIILASFCSVAGNVASKGFVKRMNPVYLVAWSQLLGGLVLLAIGLCGGGRIAPTSPMSFLTLGYICLASILAYSLWNMVVKYHPLSRLSVLKFSEPLFATLLSGLLLSENILRLNYLFAFLLILGGILISLYEKKRPTKPVENEEPT